MFTRDALLTDAERRQIVEAAALLTRIRDRRDINDTPAFNCAVWSGIHMVERVLKLACPHSPEIHRLEDVLYGWQVTCPACEAGWEHIDATAMHDAWEAESAGN